ncbi:MAG: SHOCT domain-containing protein [Actinomycetota bacterium]
MPSWCCGGGVWIMVLWIVLLVAILTGAILLVRGLWNLGDARQGQGPRRSDALTVLEERYARGEIDSEEFEERRRSLTPRPPGPA